LKIENCILTRPSRRLIGRRFDDPTVKKDIESWPFKVIDQDGSPMVEVEYLGENKVFSPQEISSMVLTKVICLPPSAKFYLTPSPL
jgi:molecular chaperone DnaK (HSP70)